MSPTPTLESDEVLDSLLEEATSEGLAELDLDPAQMPVAKSSIAYTVVIHC
jgi:hypothetical protein